MKCPINNGYNNNNNNNRYEKKVEYETRVSRSSGD